MPAHKDMKEHVLGFENCMEAAKRKMAETAVVSIPDTLDTLLVAMDNHAREIKAISKLIRRNPGFYEELRGDTESIDFTIGHAEGEAVDAGREQLKRYGGIQRLIAAEEAAEWISELASDMQGNCDRDGILEEAADVQITLTQMIMYFNLWDDLQAKIHEKTCKAELRATD